MKDNQIKLLDFATIDIKSAQNEILKDKFIEFLDVETLLFEDAIVQDIYNDEYYACDNKDPLPYSKNGFDRYLINNEVIFKSLDNQKEYKIHFNCNTNNLNDFSQKELENGFMKGKTLPKEKINQLIDLSRELKEMDENIIIHQLIDFIDEYDFYMLKKYDNPAYAFIYDGIKERVRNVNGTTEIINYLEKFEKDDNGMADQLQFELKRLRNELIPFQIKVNNKEYYLEAVENNSAFYFDDYSEMIMEVKLGSFESTKQISPENIVESEKTKADLYEDFNKKQSEFSFCSESFLENKHLQNIKNKINKEER